MPGTQEKSEVYDNASGSSRRVQPSAFEQALASIMESGDDDDTWEMLVDSIDKERPDQITPNSINAVIDEMERTASRKVARSIFKFTVKPFLTNLKAYYGIIDTLCQAGDMPGSLIWGSLKIVVDCAERYDKLFETIKNQMEDLDKHLRVISSYDDLYGDDPPMQEILCSSYVNVLRFWARVSKECKRRTMNTIMRTTATFSTDKINAIVKALKKDADDIKELGEILEKGKHAADRYQERVERIKNERFRQAQESHRMQQQEQRKVDTYDDIRAWLGHQSSLEDIERSADDHLKRYRRNHTDGTSEWISETSIFKKWSGEDSSQSIFWLSGQPGAGKSMLCSHVARELQDQHPSAAVACHFYHFWEPASRHDVLGTIAHQILTKLWAATHEIPGMVSELIHNTRNSLENILKLIERMTSSKHLPRVYILIDGADEEVGEGRWDAAADALRDLISLATTRADGKLRLWISSQNHWRLSSLLGGYPRIELTDQNESDLELFLDQKMPHLQNDIIPEDEKEELIKMLKERANGNFLWAHCMIEDLSYRLDSVAKVRDAMRDGLPWDLSDYYRDQFKRILPADKELASKIFSIVYFARRPMSIAELCDAVTMMRSKWVKDGTQRPSSRFVKRLLPPFILVTNPESDRESSCRLFDPTIKAFVKKNRFLLVDSAVESEAFVIQPSQFAELCLKYLSQPCFERGLELVNGQWRISNGRLFKDQDLLPYVAKYWDKHLDDIHPPSQVLLDRTSEFLVSPNFQTLLQIQSICVDGQFAVFNVRGQPAKFKHLRRVFPNWLVRDKTRSEGIRLWRDYRAFMHEWSYFLRCGYCENPRCAISRYSGEIDRCLFGALGKENFMSRFQSRYFCFKLDTHDASGIQNTRQCYEGYSQCGKLVLMIQFTSRTLSHLTFTCETWSLERDRFPTMLKRQIIDVEKEACHWSLYGECEDKSITVRTGRAKPVSFDEDTRFLRIGSQLFLKDKNRLFQAVNSTDQGKGRVPAYYEEHASRPGVLVVATRRSERTCRKMDAGADTPEDTMQDLANLFEKKWQEADDLSETEIESSTLDSDLPDDSPSEADVDWTSGDETWSEASTEPEDEVEDENSLVVFRGYVDSSSSGLSDDDADNDESAEESSSGSDLEATPFSRFRRGFMDDSSDGDDAYIGFSSDDDDGDGDTAIDDLVRKVFRHRKKKTDPSLEASFSVFLESSNGVRCTFRLSRSLHLILYDSPPVLHPSLPLLVWPISPSNVLFADYKQKTWFTRRLRPTQSYTRQVFVKCHFSTCGQFLHVATLEARRKPKQGAITRRYRKSKPSSTAKDPNPKTKDPLHLSLFLATYRLSTHKPTRAPPAQIHRTKLSLGPATTLPVDRLPFSLTWTPSHLFLTQSSRVLRVHKISLFGGGDAVLVPREPVFLPSTAANRAVRFFPDADGAYCVMVASEAKRERAALMGGGRAEAHWCEEAEEAVWVPKYEGVQGLEGSASLPVGFWLRGEEAFGGWVRSEDVVGVPEDRGVGRLDGKVERFDVEEDCDLEPYIL